ncbi:hypothetical protein C488_19467 [Natrinema pellirubrum DSM 15624]|uniref:Uncharacterized protein n=2 Tax=Natrinema TaxID=88723 RepID=L0JHL8_NATP1|nr:MULTISPECIES: hypothetical protein [Natrinema]ELZ15739.1 hypothetical protein C478_04524 [Natrinema thermotolerans DSM 11552]AGB30077.1 hypothetical protein Natpe_0135 [Natrinema pellirubrum DSM 15624]ELY70091.1 hypothetical protein C488_19467 [Natrinema pellirubrum DSM 15624]QCC58963.1 hypothetical protein DVR14_10085 [Natrinema thermotolerans]WMT10126.1 hypothetical protein NP511_10950 [Natrinema thermotolerans]
MLDREQLIEIVSAVGAVLLLLATMIAIGSSYTADNGSLSSEGAQLLVVAITGFILLVTAVGIGLAYTLKDEEDLDATADETETNGTF